MTKREIKRRVKKLIARELRGSFSEPPGHIDNEPREIQIAWRDGCWDLADQIDREGK